MTLEGSRLQLTRKLMRLVTVVELLIFCLHLKRCSHQQHSMCILFFCGVVVSVGVCLRARVCVNARSHKISK